MSINSETTSFTDEEYATELFKELEADGIDADEMQEFIDEHGPKDFVQYFEEYHQAVEDFDKETVASQRKKVSTTLRGYVKTSRLSVMRCRSGG